MLLHRLTADQTGGHMLLQRLAAAQTSSHMLQRSLAASHAGGQMLLQKLAAAQLGAHVSDTPRLRLNTRICNPIMRFIFNLQSMETHIQKNN